jgi:hypothetical protein
MQNFKVVDRPREQGSHIVFPADVSFYRDCTSAYIFDCMRNLISGILVYNVIDLFLG